MKISQKGLDLIKEFEGFRGSPYRCPAGKLTIGYGHVIDPNVQKSIVSGFVSITEEKAEQLLETDLNNVYRAINSFVDVFLTQGQFDAITSLIFNWGAKNFEASCGLKKLNNKDYDGASHDFFSTKDGVDEIDGKISPGLVRRRQAEWKLWQS